MSGALTNPNGFCQSLQQELAAPILQHTLPEGAGVASAENIKSPHIELDIVNEHFEGALPADKVFSKATKVLSRHGYSNSNTIFAQSICPFLESQGDGSIAGMFSDYWGSDFYILGGLAGVPFAGRREFSSLLDEIPNDGHGFVFMGPHITLLENNKLKMYARKQTASKDSLKCGKALRRLIKGVKKKPQSPVIRVITFLPFVMLQILNKTATLLLAVFRMLTFSRFRNKDYQRRFVLRELQKRKYFIRKRKTDNSRYAEIVKQLWAIGQRKLSGFKVKKDFGSKSSTLVIFSGIVIEMPKPYQDYFLPKRFQILTKDGKVEDLLEEYQRT